MGLSPLADTLGGSCSAIFSCSRKRSLRVKLSDTTGHSMTLKAMANWRAFAFFATDFLCHNAFTPRVTDASTLTPGESIFCFKSCICARADWLATSVDISCAKCFRRTLPSSARNTRSRGASL
ncbi:hypothetical protein PHG294 (plasmid) [Cupriavidus necator H16]|uniref:Uncharacterized protein n=1 Tax=Cupriavidus necator (strain ATCC 17699 / DSM 428 / KCTC 22496 / NCIMB 10442 / H16 / Stanier 337) TaxID=381666 RepID=Q7WX48_CUPNH|nr:hypothetical protein PHG294 [Cupriavidus necator H16]